LACSILTSLVELNYILIDKSRNLTRNRRVSPPEKIGLTPGSETHSGSRMSAIKTINIIALGRMQIVERGVRGSRLESWKAGKLGCREA
jgi:hypothetical protein